eukprot:gnl/TRDRNA2_/TRDRNA2_127862_c0_seq1.p1 gnl/TRDRNA2_/TRDRNA2_127862_c0~~gnl/TRDRNA2_/TRDRNA2_127862_c0_seq1.p1  ORF type:complete len:574 (-),score=74.08 gnl/TRDRNA2_/TRDRNA2_127862_c0_seq1:167-1888(-)
MGCGGSSDQAAPPGNAAPPQQQSQPQKAQGKARGAGARAVAMPNLQKKQGAECSFLQRHAPNGETWADYVAPVPPVIVNGKLEGAWFEVVYSGVVFEITNEGWDQLPEYADNGPVGFTIEYLTACGYGDSASALEEAETRCQELLKKEGPPGSRAFLQHKARNGQTWQEYLKSATPEVNKNGIASGAWGECITAAVIFEHENPRWDLLGPYSEDGPAGQVLAHAQDLGISPDKVDAVAKTEDATHKAVDTGAKLPVFDCTYYQPPVKLMQAPEVDRPPPRVSGRKKALLVGCNYPGSSAQLNGCCNDVVRWSNLLMGLYGFQQQDLVQLTDQGHGDYGRFPLRSNMLGATRWLIEGAQPGDVLFFQFSGHGGQREAADWSEADGLDEVLIPTDYERAGVIIDHELFDLLCVPLPSGVKLTVILDCCHSGSALDLPFVWNGNGWGIEQFPWHTAGDVTMFSGCEDAQCSMDASRHGRPAGAMTSCMCDVLEGHQGPPGNYPGLLQGLTNVLRERGFDQTPRLSSSQPFDVMQKPFSITDYITPNMNPQLGQAQRPPSKPPRSNGWGDDDGFFCW